MTNSENMEEKLENSLEQIIYILQESGGHLQYSRLIKRLLSKGRAQFYSINTLLDKLKILGYIEDYSQSVKLTLLGLEFKGFGDVKYKKYFLEKTENLNLENLQL